MSWLYLNVWSCCLVCLGYIQTFGLVDLFIAISLKKRFEKGSGGNNTVNTAQVTMFMKETIRLLGDLLTSSQIGEISKVVNTGEFFSYQLP